MSILYKSVGKSRLRTQKQAPHLRRIVDLQY